MTDIRVRTYTCKSYLSDGLFQDPRIHRQQGLPIDLVSPRGGRNGGLGGGQRYLGSDRQVVFGHDPSFFYECAFSEIGTETGTS